MYTPSRHVATFFIAGFQHHDGALVLEELKAGTNLALVPERDNPYDPEAVAVYFKDAMIGYIPHTDNQLLSLLPFFGHSDVFECRVLQVNKEAEPWKQVRIGIYISDKRDY